MLFVHPLQAAHCFPVSFINNLKGKTKNQRAANHTNKKTRRIKSGKAI